MPGQGRGAIYWMDDRKDAGDLFLPSTHMAASVNRYPTILALLLIPLLPANAVTPGDAANRSGHPVQAADLYRRGAEQGDADAALKLGLLISGGQVPAETFGTAGSWFIRACDLGNLVGCHNVAVGYENGPKANDGFQTDIAKAQEYYLRAAERGYLPSQYNLGSLYANQLLPDDVTGLKWLLIAQRTASSCATSAACKWVLEDPPAHIKKLRERMSSQDQALAAQQADGWVGTK